ncbi:hypothetical protein [Corynebacterium pacaense]|uniref:hypothetical protein n=1 Tax=Corynebacterium pacaense TaxID=1816684 RepID=UPI001FED043D|nr:hypothetical protein [Corynebacterium pacaense]
MTMTRGSRAEQRQPARDRRSQSRDHREVLSSRDYSTSTLNEAPPRVPAERTHSTRGLLKPGLQPTRTRKLQHKTGSQQVISVRGRRVVAPKADPRLIRLFAIVVFLLCSGVGISMGLSGMTTEQTFRLQELNSQETDLNNRIESLNRDVEDARAASTIAAAAQGMGMVSPVQPGVLAVEENGDIVEQRPADPETRPIIDINGEQARPNRASSNPDETSEVTDNLQAIPRGTANPPYQPNSTAGAVPYAATTRGTGGQAGGVGQ